MKTPTTQKEVFVVIHKPTGEFVKFGTKIAWISAGAAKSAFVLHTRTDWRDTRKFEEFTDYEIGKFYLT